MDDLRRADLSPDMIKFLGDAHESALIQNRAMLSEQFTHASKWLTASLLTVNGAGALAAINSLTQLSSPVLPLAFFVSGLVVAMLSMVAIQHISESGLAITHERIAYWQGVSRFGLRDTDAEIKALDRATRNDRLGLVAPVLGWLSGVCFIAGAVASVTYVLSENKANLSTCMRLKAQMLSHSSPQDASIIFTALRCKP